VRGGDEMGYQWYTDGKMKQKMNSFNDFISCAEHLIQEKYTSPNHLLARGGSAGGLLMGAVVNARPDLFRAVMLQVPFVDVINTMMDESLPLTTEEYEQWGNVNIKEDFDYIRQYSPYENVKTQTYPMLLFTSGVKDQQVGYWEPAKMVAKIRKLNPKGLPVLFKCDMGMGHGGSPAFYKNIEEQAFYLAYMLSAVGIAE
jgi:oligopeptidase B